LIAIRQSANSNQFTYGGSTNNTAVDIYDITNRAAPVKLHTLKQSGDYRSSYMDGDRLYLVTTYYPDIGRIESGEPMTFVPLFERDGAQAAIDESDIIIPKGTTWPSYLVMSGIDVSVSGDFISMKALYGDAGATYFGDDALYLVQTVWEGITKTILTKFSLNEGEVTPSAQATVPGYVINESSLNESNGVLRMVTTDNYNALYTLDENLNLLGSIENIAPGVQVLTCVFIGDAACIEFIGQTVSSLTIDVSDPAMLKEIGKLDTSLFLEYLWPFSESRFLGMSQDGDSDPGAVDKLKLTMLDSSRPDSIYERHSLSIPGNYSSFAYNYKATIVSLEQGLIAFSMDEKYFICSYEDQAGFEIIAEFQMS